MGPWSPAVHEYLRYLEAAGFGGAPRVLGVEDGREVLTFIDGDAAQPVHLLDDLAAAAWAFVPLAPPAQLREAGFDPLPDLPARLRSFLDGYGSPTAPRSCRPSSSASCTTSNHRAGSSTSGPISPARSD